MKTFMVTYQEVPFAYTTPHNLIIETESTVGAMRTAVIHLIKKGHCVGGVSDRDLDQTFPVVEDLLVPGGSTRIRGVKEVNLEGTLGKVIGEN